MTDIDKKEIQDGLQKKLDEFRKGLGTLVDQASLDTAMKKMEEGVKDAGVKTTEIQKTVDEIKKAAVEQGIVLTKMQKGMPEKETPSIKEQLLSAKVNLSGKEYPASEALALFKNKEFNANISLDIKAETRSSIGSDYIGFNLPGVGQLPHRRVFLRQLLRNNPVGENSHGIVHYTDQYAVTRGATSIAEGIAFPATTVLSWLGYTLPIQKIGDSVKIAREAMDDVDFITAEIQRLITLNLQLKIDYDILLGNGTAPQIYGIDARASAYSIEGTIHANSYFNPDVYGLMIVLKALITKNTMYLPDTILMNTDDAAALHMIKDLHGQYIIPPFVSNDGTLVSGMRVVENGMIPQDTMYVFDSNFVNLYTLQNQVLEFGYSGTDFTDGLVTLIGYERLALLIKTIDQGAVKKVSSISAAVLGLKKLEG